MFILGHLGVGSKIVSPWSKGLPRAYLFLGTLLPDLIDKPLYYSMVWATGRRGEQIGLICGTRTFGHTALVLLSVTFLSILKKSPRLAALALGIGSHLVLDAIGDQFGEKGKVYELSALLWPLTGTAFPVLKFTTIEDHLATFSRPFVYTGELMGLLFLSWDFWQSRHRSEILGRFKRKAK